MPQWLNCWTAKTEMGTPAPSTGTAQSERGAEWGGARMSQQEGGPEGEEA